MTRFLPEEPLPPYAYTPGRNPHPVRDKDGHSFSLLLPAPPAPDPERWQDSHDYLRGIDLFNAGYYWEAHEAWEGLWNACGRTGATARFLQALIALAAAGVKLRQGSAKGVAAHAVRAVSLFRSLEQPRFMGLDIHTLVASVGRLGTEALPAGAPPSALDIVLLPEI